jgi:CheY-like chemotaxis protein
MARVLVVDDDAAIRETLCDVLSGAGHDAESAADGFDALARVVREPAVDCLVLDMHMPRLDGAGVLAALKDVPPVVVLSAFDYVSQAEVKRQFGWRICSVLVKPVPPPVLLRTVEQCVEVRS